MNERAIRELKAMLGRLYTKAAPDDPDKEGILDFVDELDTELIEQSRKGRIDKS